MFIKKTTTPSPLIKKFLEQIPNPNSIPKIAWNSISFFLRIIFIYIHSCTTPTPPRMDSCALLYSHRSISRAIIIRTKSSPNLSWLSVIPRTWIHYNTSHQIHFNPQSTVVIHGRCGMG